MGKQGFWLLRSSWSKVSCQGTGMWWAAPILLATLGNALRCQTGARLMDGVLCCPVASQQLCYPGASSLSAHKDGIGQTLKDELPENILACLLGIHAGCIKPTREALFATWNKWPLACFRLFVYCAIEMHVCADMCAVILLLLKQNDSPCCHVGDTDLANEII